jgi:hypothetical protein
VSWHLHLLPRARRRIDAVDTWWRNHRSRAPDLFREELIDALERLKTTPLLAGTTYHMLRDGTESNDLGIDFFERRDPAKAAKRLVRRLEALGYAVDLKAA